LLTNVKAIALIFIYGLRKIHNLKAMNLLNKFKLWKLKKSFKFKYTRSLFKIFLWKIKWLTYRSDVIEKNFTKLPRTKDGKLDTTRITEISQVDRNSIGMVIDGQAFFFKKNFKIVRLLKHSGIDLEEDLKFEE
jgi:hypothetical protein